MQIFDEKRSYCLNSVPDPNPNLLATLKKKIQSLKEAHTHRAPERELQSFSCYKN